MKRFIRYLYEYENEKRIRNVGFIKVETGCEETIVHMQAKGFHNGDERRLVLYLFFEEDGEVVVIPQGEIHLTSSVLSWNLSFSENEVSGRDNYSKICGVLIESGSGRRMAATWDDRCVDVSKMKVYVPNEAGDISEPEYEERGREEAREGQSAPEERVLSPEPEERGREEAREGQSAPEERVLSPEPEERGREEAREGQSAPEERVSRPASEEQGREEAMWWSEKQQIQRICTKISRQDISRFPHCEWKLANNQFLMHGYNNFCHLLLIDDGKHLKLGVPGIYHIKEAKCARDFGFEEFLSAEELGIFDDSKDNQEEWFGYWCRPVKRRCRR